MPGYKAVITGENFEFLIDDEPQHLDFIRTVYVEAPDETKAGETALKIVRGDLLAQSLLDDNSDQLINLDLIFQAENKTHEVGVCDFIWSFPDYDE